MHGWEGTTRLSGDLPFSWLVMLLLASIVQFYVGAVFYRQAHKGLRNRCGARPPLRALSARALGALAACHAAPLAPADSRRPLSTQTRPMHSWPFTPHANPHL
jgi:cation transport ATPase